MVLRGCAPAGADESGRMAVIDHDNGVVGLGESRYLIELRNVNIYAEYKDWLVPRAPTPCSASVTCIHIEHHWHCPQNLVNNER
jgi:hypothetical protein